MIKQLGGKLGLVALIGGLTTPAMANTFMDAAWAAQACNAWNKNNVLTTQLMNTEDEDSSYSWISNDAGRGYKLIQIYRTKCGPATKIQLNIVKQGNKAHCAYGGVPDGKAMNKSVDYIMHATDANWACMGKGSFGCGAMGAMMTGKLKFVGPKMEAMKVMSPFESFLKLAGKVPGDTASCPAAKQ
jgi:putative sterol carrier protein